MILHLVLFRPRASLNDDARRGLAKAFADAINEIGSIKRARIGRRRTHGRAYEQLMRENYTHAAILEFEDLAGLAGVSGASYTRRIGVAFLRML